jgi:hypothetical protein
MKAPFNLDSAIEKIVLVMAFLPLVFMVYPESVAAAYTAQDSSEKALVFEISSKQKTNQQLAVTTVTEVNPTLSNPCYPAPIGSCNPDASPGLQPEVQAMTASLTSTMPGYNGKTYSKEEVQQLIVQYSAEYGINSATPLCIARLESGYNQFSKNRSSSASGVFQYLTSTWRHTDEGKAGHSVFDANANVKAAVKYMAIHKSTQPWVVKSKCPAIAFTK